MRILSIIAFILLTFNVNAQYWEWASSIGGSDADRSLGLATDSAGNTFVTGHFVGTSTFGTTTLSSSGSDEIFIAKYNGLGTMLWAVQAGGTGMDRGYEMTTDSDGNAYLTGLYTNTATFGSITVSGNTWHDIFLTKISPSGTFLWVKTITSTNALKGFDVDVDTLGNIYVSGDIKSTATFSSSISLSSSGYFDGFVAKYDSSGTCLWANKFGGTGADKSQGLAVTPNGNVFVSGYFSGTCNFSGISKTSNGGFDACHLKYNTNGNIEWVKTGGGSGDDVANSVDVDLYGTATFDTSIVQSNGGRDLFITKYDSIGVMQWLDNGGGTGDDRMQCINIDDDNNLMCIGTFSGSLTLGNSTVYGTGSDGFLCKYLNDGNLIWLESVGGIGTDAGTSIDTDYDGEVYVTGIYEDTVTFGINQLVSVGSADVFVAKLTKVPVDVSLIGLSSSYCIDDLPDTLSGYPGNGYFSGNGMVGNIFYPSLAGAGTHIIYYTASSTTESQSIVVSDLNETFWINDTSFCEGETITLNFNPDHSYVWNNGSTNSIITIDNPGLYIAEMIDSLNCIFIDTLVAIELPAPMVSLGSDTAIVQGTSIILDAGIGYNDYLWSTTEVSQTIVVSNQGTYSVTVSDNNGCTGSDEINVQVLNTITQLDEIKVFVYPNPARELLNIEIKPFNRIQNIRIMDLGGKELRLDDMSKQDNLGYQLDLSLFRSGVYIIEIRTSSMVFQQKVILN